MKSPRALATLVLVWFALSGAGPALGGRVVAMQPRIEPPKGAELRDRFQDAVSRGLQQGGAEVVPNAEVRARLLANEELSNCSSGACLTQVLGDLKAERLALTEIAVEGKSYLVTLRLIDQGGAEVWRTTERCEVCRVPEAEETLVRAASRMGPWVNRPGPTDQARAAQRPQPSPPAQPPSPQAPQAPPAAAPLPAAPPPEPPRRWTPYRYGWIASLGAAGALAVASLPFLIYASREGQTTCDPSIPSSACPTIYRGNLGAGLGLLLGGAVGIAGGAFAVFYYLDHKAQHKPRARALFLPTAGGGFVGVEGQF